jgi:hypothetical protein
MQLKINSKTLAAGVAMAALSFASAASAGTVVIKNIQGVWSSQSPTGTVSTSGNTSTVSWGTPSEGTMKSSYAFTSGGPINTSLNDGDSAGPFTIGQFQHNNWPVTGTTLETVRLTVSGVIEVGGQDISFSGFVYDFTHFETPNEGSGWNGACALGGKNGDSNNKYGCSDLVKVNTNTFNNSITVGNDTYTIDIAGFLVNGNLTDSFITKESKVRKYGCGFLNLKTCYDYTTYAQSNTADIQARISMVTSAVPEPSTWAMMIVGFGAAGAMVRSSRRRGALAA